MPQFSSGQDMLPLVQQLEQATKAGVDPDTFVHPGSGAVGRFQVTPGTSAEYGGDKDPAVETKNLQDPAYNKAQAGKILDDLHTKFGGDTNSVLVGYHSGPGVANKYGGSPPDTMPLTQGYLARAAKLLPGISPVQASEPAAAAPTTEAQENTLPTVYQNMAKARAAGYSWDEINAQVGGLRQKAQEAGFTNSEINKQMGLPEGYGPPDAPAAAAPTGPTTLQRGVMNVSDAISENLNRPLLSQNLPGPVGVLVRSAETWGINLPAALYSGGVTGVVEGLKAAGMEPNNAGRLQRDLQGLPEAFAGMLGFGGAAIDLRRAGTTMEDVHTVYGQKMTAAIHATRELSEGRPMSPEYAARLKEEATPYASMPSVVKGLKGRPSAAGFPVLPDMIDATTSVARGREYPVNEMQDVTLPKEATHTGATPAIQYQGKTYEGTNHIEAMGAAANDTGHSMEKVADSAEHGTTEGGVFRGSDQPEGMASPKITTDAAGKAMNDQALQRIDDETLGGNSMTRIAQNLGKNFAETGEHPLDAAERAQNDGPFAALLKSETGGGGGEGYSAFNPVTGEGQALAPTAAFISRPQPASVLGKLKANLQHWFAPQSMTAESRAASRVLITARAEQDLGSWKSTEMLRGYGRAIADLTPEQQASLLHSYETGDLGAYRGTPIGAAAQAMHGILDYHWEQMKQRGIITAYRENYMQHLYENPEAASGALSQMFSSKARGAQSFTRDRIFSTYFEALTKYGLKPKTTDIFELGLATARQQQAAISHFDILKELQQRGLAREKPLNLSLKDQWEYTNTVPLNAKMLPRTVGGQWVASPEVAQVVNRYLQPTWDGTPIYDLVRSAGNTMNMANFTLSGFHLKYMAGASILARNAKGIQQMSRLTPAEMVRGLGNTIASPITPFRDGIIGRKIINQVMGTKDYGPHFGTLADLYVAGGNHLKYDRFYQTSAMGSFWDNIKGSIEAQEKRFTNDDGTGAMTLGQAVASMYRNAEPIKIGGGLVVPSVVRATAMLVPRALATVMHPLMGVLVPAMKAGAWADKMADELRMNPTMSRDEQVAISQRITHHVENLEGEMIADNRFLDKNLMATGNLTVRVMTWTLGKMDELFGGAADLAKGRTLAVGATHQITERAATVASLAVTSVQLGAWYGAMMGTWNAGWTLYDYLHPPTGGNDSAGGPERTNLLGLLTDYDEVTGGVESVTNMLTNKVHPQLSMLWQLAHNADFYGATISNPDDPTFERGKDYADFLLQQYEPFSLRTQPGQEESAYGPLGRAMGFKPAPFAIEEPDSEASFQAYELKKGLKKKDAGK